MRTLRNPMWICLLVLPLVAGGCMTKLDVVFENPPGNPDVAVTLLGAGLVLPWPQTVPVAANGTAAFKVRVPKPWQPANFRWTAENSAANFPKTGTFVVTDADDGITKTITIN